MTYNHRLTLVPGTYTALKECIALSEHTHMFAADVGLMNGCRTLNPGRYIDTAANSVHFQFARGVLLPV